jgi:hypothetical protein
MRIPLKCVPLELPRSRSVQTSPSFSTAACALETRGSDSATVAVRPIVNSRSSQRTILDSDPSCTRSSITMTSRIDGKA